MQKLSQTLDTLVKYGIAAILIAVPLYPKFPFIQVPGIYVSIRIEDFLILGVSILWFISIIPNLKKLWANTIVRAIILFLVTALLATASGILFLHTVDPLVGILQWGRRVEYFMGFFIALTTIKSRKDVEFYVKCIGIVLILAFLFGMGQKYFDFPVITTQNSEYSKGIALRYVPGGHIASTFAGHYDLATYIILTSPIFFGLLFLKKEALKEFINGNEKIIRGIIIAIIATSFWLMVNAASRISALSYVISVSTTLFIIRKYKYIPVIAIITLIFAFATSNLFDRYLNIFDVIKSKLIGLIPRAYAQGTTSPPAVEVIEDRSTSIRLNVEWPRAIRAFLKNPLLGTGYASTTLATDNDYLRALGETGILGVISMFFVYFRICLEFFKKSWPGKFFGKKELDFKTVFLAGVIGAIPGLMLNAVFIDIFEASKFAISFWLIVGLAFSLVYAKNLENN